MPMTTVTLELPPELYERLRAEAQQIGAPIEALIEDWLARRFPPLAATGERERARAVLRAAGLLAEPSQEMKDIAAQSTLSLEEARKILDRAGGKPLSEVILEMRGPKE